MNCLEKFKLFFTISIISINSRVKCDPSIPIPLGRLPSDINLEKVNKYYETLYLRLVSKDYGFAHFGQPCEVLSINEIEDFLDLGHVIIKDQQEDGKYRRAVEEHLRPKLRYFFDRSRTYCDFRRLLTCDKKHRKCSCPHSSMGVGRNGTCQINIGKRCDLTKDRLNSLGILVLEKETSNITCIGEAECVTSFGAATKICKCRSGYWGSSCRSSRYGNSPIFGGGVGPLGRSFIMGRGFWVPDDQDDNQDFFLYPEEIKAELVKMMDFREMFEPEEREKEAEELYQKMDSDPDKEDMITFDIHIRKLARLEYGEPCDSKKQTIIENPPIAKEGSSWVDPKPIEIIKWQESLLEDSQPICNYINYLKCDSEKKVCLCKDGLLYQDGKCKAKVGHPCGSDYDGVFEFDPLKDRKRFSPAYSPLCINGATCLAKPLFFLKQCWCDSGKTCDLGPDGEDPTPADILADVNSRFTLNLGEDCDPESQQILINPPDLEKSDFKLRRENLEKLLKQPELKFCDINKYYNCTETLKKCQCWEDMIEENGQCRVENLDSCEDNYVYGAEFYPDGSKMWKVEEIFQKKFLPQCIKNAKCGSEEVPGKCFCKNGNGGPTCEDPKSVFASVLNPSNVFGYNKDSIINKVFYKLNYYMYKIEELMTLKYNDKCDYSVGVMISRIRAFFLLVGSSDDNIARTKTLHQYSKTAKWAKFLLRTGATELCNAFLGLSCHQTTEKCRCPKGYIYEDKICKLNVHEECDETPLTNWIPPCRNNSACQPSLSNFKHACLCKEGFMGESCSDTNNNTIDEDKNKNKTNPNNSTEPSCPPGVIPPNDLCDNNPFGPNNKNGTNGDTKNKTETPDRFDEIDEMLKEIMDHRNLPLDKPCEYLNEDLFTKMFPHLPRFDRLHYNHLPLGVKETYSKLRWIYNAGFNFCDRRKYYTCGGNGVCQCGEKNGLIRASGKKRECKLKEFSFCGEIGTFYDVTQPVPVCMEGTKCVKLNYGIHKCISDKRLRQSF